MKKNNKERGAMSPLGWLLLIIIGMWVLWYFSGGPQRANTVDSPYMQPVNPYSTTQ